MNKESLSCKQKSTQRKRTKRTSTETARISIVRRPLTVNTTLSVMRLTDGRPPISDSITLREVHAWQASSSR